MRFVHEGNGHEWECSIQITLIGARHVHQSEEVVRGAILATQCKDNVGWFLQTASWRSSSMPLL